MRAAHSQPLRQAFALAYAMQARPTPALASRYFEALRRVLEDNDKTGVQDTAQGEACSKRSIPQHC